MLPWRTHQQQPTGSMTRRSAPSHLNAFNLPGTLFPSCSGESGASRVFITNGMLCSLRQRFQARYISDNATTRLPICHSPRVFYGALLVCFESKVCTRVVRAIHIRFIICFERYLVARHEYHRTHLIHATEPQAAVTPSDCLDIFNRNVSTAYAEARDEIALCGERRRRPRVYFG